MASKHRGLLIISAGVGCWCWQADLEALAILVALICRRLDRVVVPVDVYCWYTSTFLPLLDLPPPTHWQCRSRSSVSPLLHLSIKPVRHIVLRSVSFLLNKLSFDTSTILSVYFWIICLPLSRFHLLASFVTCAASEQMWGAAGTKKKGPLNRYLGASIWLPEGGGCELPVHQSPPKHYSITYRMVGLLFYFQTVVCNNWLYTSMDVDVGFCNLLSKKL
jgi:hypothetical protein